LKKDMKHTNYIGNAKLDSSSDTWKVIDNFLDEEYFNSLITLLTEEHSLPWYLNCPVYGIQKKTGMTQPGYTEAAAAKEAKFFYMTHMFYIQNSPTGALYENLIPLLKKMEVRRLLRIKANFYPNTEILHEHPMHTDTDFSHTGAILSLNTCDGYTKLRDGTKIDSVANRMLLFDASKEHCSTTTTNVPVRYNININYIQEQKK